MMKTLLITTVLVMFAAPKLAFHCSKDMAEVDAATQVLAARVFVRLNDESWARDLADQLYFNDETRT